MFSCTQITAVEQRKEIEENIRIENTDFCLQSVYDPAQFHGNIFRVKKDLTQSIIPITIPTVSFSSTVNDNDLQINQNKEFSNKIYENNYDKEIETAPDKEIEIEIETQEKNSTSCQEISLNKDTDKDTLRIMIPVAGVEGDFRMIPGNENNMGRKCETEVQVLQYGTYQVRTYSVWRFFYNDVFSYVDMTDATSYSVVSFGFVLLFVSSIVSISFPPSLSPPSLSSMFLTTTNTPLPPLQGHPVTKVLLMPLTGRRHQLRVHCLCLGHPIGHTRSTVTCYVISCCDSAIKVCLLSVIWYVAVICYCH
jgi:hypothetical protein